MDLRQGLNRFSTAETCMMAEFSSDTLRTWRARGLLPEHTHWNGRYDALQVCALAIRKLMVLQGESPKHTAGVARRLAPAVLCAALRRLPEIAAAPPRLDDRDALNWRYLVSVDQQAYEPARDLADVVSGDVASGEVASLRCIDLHALGSRIGQLAPKPLVVATDAIGAAHPPFLRSKDPCR